MKGRSNAGEYREFEKLSGSPVHSEEPDSDGSSPCRGSLDQELIELYWSIAKENLDRQASEGWGTQVIDYVPTELSNNLLDNSVSIRKSKLFRSRWKPQERAGTKDLCQSGNRPKSNCVS